MIFVVSVLLLAPVLTMTANAMPIALGQNVYDTISNAEVDSFTFAVVAGDYVLARVLMTSDFGGQGCCCFDQQIIVRGPSGEEVATAVSPFNNNCCGCRFLMSTGSFRIESGGTHTLYIGDRNQFGRGSYALFVQRLNAPGRADTLHAGVPYLGNVSTSGKVDSYVLFGEAGHPIELTMVAGPSGSLNPILELYDPTGRAVALPNSGKIVYTPIITGNFTLLASSASTETGVYTINFFSSLTPIETTTWGAVKALYR
ncbi:MAG: hypothetical protein V1838_01830 [Patescibacteria group bacterium]